MAKRGEQKRQCRPRRKQTTKSQRARHQIPSKASIVSTETFTSPKGRSYTIIETNQVDPYDNANEKDRKRGRD